ncbi:MAG: hypothetical protein KIT14_03320 [bacterium]|nr:hypothetical protein [bacterium]
MNRSTIRVPNPVRSLGVGLLGLVMPALAEAQPLRTDLDSYFIFAMRNASLKNMDVLSPCNTGVNCAQPSTNSSCGSATHENSFYADGSQIAADFTRWPKNGANIFQLFSNRVNSPQNVTIRQPGPGPNGANPLSLPILGDLDGDGVPSCQTVGQQCVPDFGDLEAFCGLPNPFPACDLTKTVVVSSGGDCVGVPDSSPGNRQCDLPAGTYGNLTVQNGASISFDGGTYQFCSVNMGKNTNSTVKALSTVNVSGNMSVNNGSTFGAQCGDFTVNAAGGGAVSFGRNASVSMFLCAPQRNVSLGHNNDLLGRFVGDVVNSDSNNRGRCCGSRCACFDDFTPTTASVGGVITLTSGCSLSSVSGVKICAIPATIVAQGVNEIQVRVPAGAAGACPVEVESSAGTFIASHKLTVS